MSFRKLYLGPTASTATAASTAPTRVYHQCFGGTEFEPGRLAATPAADQIEKPTPAQIKKSITPDALISFEDGKSYKTLRRHLTLRGLTPEAYRAKYGLSADYPMTAASYSAQRSELARALGLGNSRKGQTKAKAAAIDEKVSEAPSEAKLKKAHVPMMTKLVSDLAEVNSKTSTYTIDVEYAYAGVLLKHTTNFAEAHDG